jgi:hypothetical protein
MEAMNSLTLMDPRMDSGASTGKVEHSRSRQFDANERLLPGEVCAIMDRLLSCEVSEPAVVQQPIAGAYECLSRDR